mmetsp:Transcript_20410/g.54445  ORF Transcript_20410/g.54445 Transcript_20410/m.54445 type:complete len:91 (+) Transcript_20410:2546-2818(+)
MTGPLSPAVVLNVDCTWVSISERSASIPLPSVQEMMWQPCEMDWCVSTCCIISDASVNQRTAYLLERRVFQEVAFVCDEKRGSCSARDTT